MKAFRALLVLLVLATLGALAWHALAADPGYVQVVWRGWSLESTVLVAVGAVLLIWLLLRLLIWLVRAPWMAWRGAAQRRARLGLADGLLALREGRWQRADRLLQRAAAHPEFELIARIEAARGARDRGNAEQIAQWLEPLGNEPLAELERATDLLANGEHAAACARLEAAAAQRELPPRGWWLRVQTLIACGRVDEALALLPELRRLTVLSDPELLAEEARLAAQALSQCADYNSLRRARRLLSRSVRRQVPVIAAYAECSAHLGLIDVAAKAIELSLRHTWSEELAELYGRLPGGDYPRRLRAAETWLTEHPGSVALLLSLGRLCREDGLWGKAESYLEQALKAGAGAPAWEALGLTFAAQGEEAHARLCLENALRLTRGDSSLALPARARRIASDIETTEERSTMGVPRLPARQTARELEGES